MMRLLLSCLITTTKMFRKCVSLFQRCKILCIVVNKEIVFFCYDDRWRQFIYIYHAHIAAETV